MNYEIKFGLLSSLLYSIIMIYNQLKKKKINPEIFKLINYSIWFIVSLYSHMNNKYEFFSMTFVTMSMIYNFTYELMFNTPDIAHTIHHLLTIFAIIIAFPLKLYNYNIIPKVCNIFIIGMCSSIFSSLRKLLKDTIFKETSYHFYKLTYIFFKFWAIIKHYHLSYNNLYLIKSTDQLKKAFFAYSLVHFIQLYFINKIFLSYL